MSKLTARQRAFVDEYVQCWNATEAAIAAGYAPEWITTNTTKILDNTNVQEYLAQIVAQKSMSVDEALIRLADIARSDFGDALNIQKGYTGIDINRLKEKGLTHLIKKWKHTKDGITLEFHDPMAAIDKILRAGGAYHDKLDITSDGNEIKALTWNDGTDATPGTS